MKKIFSTKVQEISSSNIPINNHLSLAYHYDPQDLAMEEARGKLFGVVDISSDFKGFDLNLSGKMALSVLKETYYSNLEGTPLQALENAVHKTKEKITTMVSSESPQALGLVDLNLLAAALWGKVLYIAQFGSCTAYLLRNGSVLDIGKDTKGEVIVSSGIIEKSDVLVLGSSKFKDYFPSSSIIKDLPKLNSLDFLSSKVSLSAVLVKFDVTELPGKEEIIGFVIPKTSAISDKVSKAKGSFSKLFSRKREIKVPSLNFNQRPKRKIAVLAVSTLAVLIALCTSVYFTLLKSRVTGPSSSKQVIEDKGKTLDEIKGKLEEVKSYLGPDDEKAKSLLEEILSANVPENLGAEDRSKFEDVLNEAAKILDDLTNVTRIESAVVYSTLTDGIKSPLGIVSEAGTFYIWDKDASSIVRLRLVGGKINSERKNSNIKANLLIAYQNLLYAIVDDSLYSSSFEDLNFVKSPVSGDLGFAKANIAKVYFGNIYLLNSKENTLKKLSVLENGFAADNWLKEDAVLTNASDMTIDGNIYVLFSDVNVEKFYVGKKEDFSLKQLPYRLKEPAFIYTNSNIDKLYILDKGDGSIVILDKEGKYRRKVIIENKKVDFKNTLGFVVSPSQEDVFVLVGTDLVRVHLSQN